MSFASLKLGICLFAVASCSGKSAGGGGGAKSSSANVTADVAVKEDDATAFVQAGESISVAGTNLSPTQQYVVRMKRLMPEGQQVSESAYDSVENLKLDVPVSFYTILDITTPVKATFSAVVLKPNQDSQVNLRFDETSTVAAKILEIIYDKALKGNADAGYLLRHRALSVANLYSIAASALLVNHEQERRKSLKSGGDQSAFNPVDLVSLADGLVRSVRTELSDSQMDVNVIATREADASYKYFYKQSLEVPTAIAAYITPQAGPQDVVYRASLVNPVVAAAYSDLSQAYRNQSPSTPVGDLTEKAASLFMQTFGQCIEKNACPAIPPVSAAKFQLAGKVDLPTFTDIKLDGSSNKVVKIISPTDGAVIYYTLDGSNPSPASSRFSDAITVGNGQILKAVAIKDGYESSDFAEATSFTRSDLDHDIVKSKSVKVPNLAVIGDLMVLVVMHKFDQTNPDIPPEVRVSSGFTLVQSSRDITGPTSASGEDILNRYQRVSVFLKKFDKNDSANVEVSYPDGADADQLTLVLVTIPSSSSSIRDYQEGNLTAMNQPAFFAPVDRPLTLAPGERVIYVASSLFLAEALDDRENVMVVDNVNIQGATNKTAKILGRNSHWRNKLAVLIDSVADPLVTGFYPSRGFDGDNLANSNLGLRFVVPK
jgi:hypothetical protein